MQVFLNMARKRWLRVFSRLARSSRELYRVCFVARAGEIGLLELLAGEPVTVQGAADALGFGGEQLPSLEAFLDLGVSVGELRLSGGRYGLKGFLSRALARSANDPWQAFASEVARLHSPCLLGSPGEEADRERIARVTVDLSSVIARSSRLLEPMMGAVVRELVPARGPLKLLEIGCGSGVYVRAALGRNPELTATALEREQDVARNAEDRIGQAGFGDRCRVVTADVRSLSFGPEHDLITLYNNIYYFPEEERGALLARLHSWLKPGGRLAVTTPCRGGGLFSRFMMLWSVITAGTGPLPAVDRFLESLEQAGFVNARASILMPGDTYTLFVAEKS